MLKIRITFNKNNESELEQAIEILEKEFEVIDISREYDNRNSSYSRVYADVELKTETDN